MVGVVARPRGRQHPHLSPNEERIADLLADGRWRSKEALIDALWGDDPNGGPLQAGNQIAVHICRLRQKGFAFDSRYGRGYRILYDPRKSLVEGVRWSEVCTQTEGCR